MSAKETTVYPIARRWTHAAPHAVHIVGSKAEADELVASGAFTLDPKDPDRDLEAPDLTKPPEAPAEPDPADAPAGGPTPADGPAPDAEPPAEPEHA